MKFYWLTFNKKFSPIYVMYFNLGISASAIRRIFELSWIEVVFHRHAFTHESVHVCYVFVFFHQNVAGTQSDTIMSPPDKILFLAVAKVVIILFFLTF